MCVRGGGVCWVETTCTLVPWRQGFKHPTRNKCMVGSPESGIEQVHVHNTYHWGEREGKSVDSYLEITHTIHSKEILNTSINNNHKQTSIPTYRGSFSMNRQPTSRVYFPPPPCLVSSQLLLYLCKINRWIIITLFSHTATQNIKHRQRCTSILSCLVASAFMLSVPREPLNERQAGGPISVHEGFSHQVMYIYVSTL